MQNLVEKTFECLNFTERQKEIFEDLVLFNLHNRRDHAIVSALFTVMSFTKKGTSEDNAYKVAIPIFLHNLYQWKFYAYKEINDFKINEEFRASSLSSEDFAYKFENSNLISFVFERRFKDPLDRKKERKAKIDEFKKLLKEYKGELSSIQIRVDEAISDEKHEMTPLHGRFSIYKDLRIFLTRKSARISPCLEGSCAICFRKSSIFNIRSKSLGWEFGRFPLFPKCRSQACQGFRGFVKLGFWADFRTHFGVSSFIISLICYATLTMR